MNLVDRYLALLKSALLNDLYLEADAQIAYLLDAIDGEPFDVREYFAIHRERPDLIEAVAESHRGGRHLKGRLRYVTTGATMIGRLRLDNLHECMSAVIDDDVPGDFIECGVWRGGACVFVAGFLAAHDANDRNVWVADSFAGLPPPSLEQDAGLDLSGKKYPMLVVDEEYVRDLFRRFDLDGPSVRFVKGWFRDTLRNVPADDIAVLRIDGDLYESTMDALKALYHKVPSGGFVIVDDYGALEQCALATDEFRASNGITDPLVDIDGIGVYWRKG